MSHSVSIPMIFVSAIFARLITNCTRQMTRTTLTAKMAAIAHAMPRHTSDGIQALFCLTTLDLPPTAKFNKVIAGFLILDFN